MGDKTNWVTVKVPEEQRDKAKEHQPNGTTYADCLVTGARTLAEEPNAELTATVTPTLDEDRVDELVADLKSRVGEADPSGGSALDYADVKEAAREAMREVLEEYNR